MLCLLAESIVPEITARPLCLDAYVVMARPPDNIIIARIPRVLATDRNGEPIIPPYVLDAGMVRVITVLVSTVLLAAFVASASADCLHLFITGRNHSNSRAGNGYHYAQTKHTCHHRTFLSMTRLLSTHGSGALHVHGYGIAAIG